MITPQQKERAKKFSEMHKKNEMFVLPNCWNAMSAKIFENEGFEAVATSSAGLAFGLGYPDGECISMDDLVTTVDQITKRINIPLSVDFEGGYSDSPEGVKENARRLLEVGAVGFNLEDGKADGTLEDVDKQLAKIKALVELKEELDLEFVINARTCAYWLNIGDDEAKLKIAGERGNAFKEAGADCIFVPGFMDEKTITDVVNAIDAPVNIILTSTFYDFGKLRKIGVTRYSVGFAPANSVIKHTMNIASELNNDNISTMATITTDYFELNKMFGK